MAQYFDAANAELKKLLPEALEKTGEKLANFIREETKEDNEGEWNVEFGVCDYCLDKQAKWNSGEDRSRKPPVHSNCRCSLSGGIRVEASTEGNTLTINCTCKDNPNYTSIVEYGTSSVPAKPFLMNAEKKAQEFLGEALGEL